jgi:hypothetical protein
MPEEIDNSDLKIRLETIETQLKELHEAIADIQEELKEQLNLVTDIERYKNLKKFLKEQNFQAADQETTKVMLEVAGEDRDNLTPEDLTKFPCNALLVIDNLWKNYSNQHFGFSLQLNSYYSVGGTIDTIRAQDINTLKKFADKVGWLNENGQPNFPNYEHWDFSLAAPKGCFPAHWWKSPYGLKMVTFFFSRLIACDV